MDGSFARSLTPLQHLQELRRGPDKDMARLLQCQQITVSADDYVGLANDGTRNHPVIIRITADARDGLRQIHHLAQG